MPGIFYRTDICVIYFHGQVVSHFLKLSVKQTILWLTVNVYFTSMKQENEETERWTVKHDTVYLKFNVRYPGIS